MLMRYPGGKNKKSVQQKILSKAPLFYSEYREPFAGSAGIFWKIDVGIKRWINDLDEDLISVYLSLRDNPKEFIARCKEIEPEKEDEALTSSRANGKVIYNARLKKKFDELLENPITDLVSKALKYYFINRTNWAGRTDYTRPSRLYFSNPSGWNIVKTNKLEKAAELLQEAKITIGDYKKVLSEPGKDVFCYLDPPYYVNSGFDKGSLLYRHNFTREDHINLVKEIQNCQHKVLLSYDNDEEGFIKSLYSDPIFYIYEENWTYCGSSLTKKKVGKELIITNYKD